MPQDENAVEKLHSARVLACLSKALKQEFGEPVAADILKNIVRIEIRAGQELMLP